MLFFKPKRKTDELIPPPPPDIELKEKPELFDKIISTKKEKSENFPEKEEFNRLVKELSAEKPKKTLKPKKAKNKIKVMAKPKITKKEIKIKKIQPKKIKEKKSMKKPKLLKKQKLPPKLPKKSIIKHAKKQKLSLKTKLKKSKSTKRQKPQIKPIIKQTKTKKTLKPKTKQVKKEPESDIISEISKPEENLEQDIGLGLPKKFEKIPKEISDIKLPETLEELDAGFDVSRTKPMEIQDAEEEIRSAIEKIKEHEKPSFFKRLFKKKSKEEKHEEPMMFLDKVSMTQDNINKAREALMKFDLETAKKRYIDAMKLYSALSPEDKAKVYQDIKELYFERKSAETIKV